MKCDAAGNIVKYKARLVAQGFTQAQGVNFNETFTPLAKLTSNCIILALATRNDWEVHQVNVKNTYLNAELDKEIYMMQPPGFTALGCEDWVCLLKKALYGLKQAGRQWYTCLTDAFLKFGYTCCEMEHCIFVRWSGCEFKAIIVAVDDLMIVVTLIILVEDATLELESVFKISDLGEVHWLLGIEITWDHSTTTISLLQTTYIDAITSHFDLDNAKPVSMPMELELTLSVTQCPKTLFEINEMKSVPYKVAVSSLMYAAIGTCPDIAL